MKLEIYEKTFGERPNNTLGCSGQRTHYGPGREYCVVKAEYNHNGGAGKSCRKCHFCNLMFYEGTERSAHEETWHAKKLLLKSSNSSLRSDGDADDRKGVSGEK